MPDRTAVLCTGHAKRQKRSKTMPTWREKNELLEKHVGNATELVPSATRRRHVVGSAASDE
jgi:hypothetical protein